MKNEANINMHPQVHTWNTIIAIFHIPAAWDDAVDTSHFVTTSTQNYVSN